MSSKTNISLSAATEVDGIVFTLDRHFQGSAFTITATPRHGLSISGAGITNNSGITQNFVSTAPGPLFGGPILFENSATAGSLTVFTSNGGMFNDVSGGAIIFIGTSTAGNGTFTNNGAAFSGTGGGFTLFDDDSDAGSATLIATAGLNGGDGGLIDFSGRSTGGTARVEVFGNGSPSDFTSGRLNIAGRTSLSSVTIGSLEGNGLVFLGANDLTVGSNNLSKTFSGLIQDGNNGTGGSLTKTGTGKLTLTTGNTYTGATTVNGGTLLVKNKAGSATGNGMVQVNTGTLGGVGKISGAVTVGTGTTSPAILLAGNSAASSGTLTINNPLTFRSLSTYKCVLNRTTPKASKVSAFGVTINGNVPFTFVDVGSGTLATGTVFTAVNNISNLPISGRFSNLPNGSIFTSNGTRFKANYTGGTGNDLTLTVVP